MPKFTGREVKRSGGSLSGKNLSRKFRKRLFQRGRSRISAAEKSNSWLSGSIVGITHFSLALLLCSFGSCALLRMLLYQLLGKQYQSQQLRPLGNYIPNYLSPLPLRIE